MSGIRDSSYGQDSGFSVISKRDPRIRHFEAPGSGISVGSISSRFVSAVVLLPTVWGEEDGNGSQNGWNSNLQKSRISGLQSDGEKFKINLTFAISNDGKNRKFPSR